MSQGTVTMRYRGTVLLLATATLLLSGCSSDQGQESPNLSKTSGSLIVQQPETVGPPLRKSCPVWGLAGVPDSYQPTLSRGSVTGDDVVVKGYVLEAGSCRPIGHMVIEFWHTSPDGKYLNDKFRSSTSTDSTGAFSLSLSKPGVYEDVQPHVHLLVSGDGFESRSFNIDTLKDSSGVDLVIIRNSGV
jgi:hypothetical protein